MVPCVDLNLEPKGFDLSEPIGDELKSAYKLSSTEILVPNYGNFKLSQIIIIIIGTERPDRKNLMRNFVVVCWLVQLALRSLKYSFKFN